MSSDSDNDGLPDYWEINLRSDPSDSTVHTLVPNRDWTFSVNGQVAAADVSGSIYISNISAPDFFGAGGPGTIADFESDDYVRAIGVKTQDGVNHYAYSEFFKIRQGETHAINSLTFTATPPKKPDMLAAVPDQAVLAGALGQTTQVRVTATFADKTTGDVTPATNWTTYRSSNVAL
jgi:hypothetical protein